MESQAVRTAPKDLNRFPFRDIRRQPSRSIHAIAEAVKLQFVDPLGVIERLIHANRMRENRPLCTAVELEPKYCDVGNYQMAGPYR
jgi:hypothetical protein